MGMRVETVAAPVRYRRGPLLALLVIAIVPAVGLSLVYGWADAEAERYDDSRSAVEQVSGADPPRRVRAATELRAPLYDLRRAPESAARLASANRLRRQLRPVWQFVDDDSCAAVSVNGIRTGAVNATTPVRPASNQKLFTAAVALETLGPDHRYTTRVVGPRPRRGVIQGDIHLVGGGDPLLTADDFPIDEDRRPAFHTTSLDSLADQLVSSGVTTVEGAVLGDGSRYDDEWFVDSWGDGVAFEDAGPYDALLVNDARRVGSASVQSDPNDAAAEEFVRLLTERGVVVTGGAGTGEAPDRRRVLASVRSARLEKVVEEMLVNSDNNTAEMVLKEIGYVVRGEGTRVAGLNVVDSTLRSWDIPMDGVRALDGSGLSLDNRVTCAAVLALLQREADGPLPELLPVAAQSGTLAQEFTESPMAGRMAAKTGTLENLPVEEGPPAVKALSGYVDARRGDRIEFALILTTPDIALDRRFAPLWQQLGQVLATYPSGPGVSTLGPL